MMNEVPASSASACRLGAIAWCLRRGVEGKRVEKTLLQQVLVDKTKLEATKTIFLLTTSEKLRRRLTAPV